METLGTSGQGRASWKPPINLRLKEVRSHLNMDELNSKGLSGRLIIRRNCFMAEVGACSYLYEE